MGDKSGGGGSPAIEDTDRWCAGHRLLCGGGDDQMRKDVVGVRGSASNGDFLHRRRRVGGGGSAGLLLVVFVIGCFVADSRAHAKHFTADELQRTKFPSRVSDDLDLDPCKSGKPGAFFDLT